MAHLSVDGGDHEGQVRVVGAVMLVDRSEASFEQRGISAAFQPNFRVAKHSKQINQPRRNRFLRSDKLSRRWMDVLLFANTKRRRDILGRGRTWSMAVPGSGIPCASCPQAFDAVDDIPLLMVAVTPTTHQVMPCLPCRKPSGQTREPGGGAACCS